jgi:hypothetical protein
MRNLFSGIGGTSPAFIEQNTSSSFCFGTTLISFGNSFSIISFSFSPSTSDSDDDDSDADEADEEPEELSEDDDDDDELDLDEFDETDDLLFSSQTNPIRKLWIYWN